MAWDTLRSRGGGHVVRGLAREGFTFMRPLRSRALAALTGVAALSLALVAPTAFAAPGSPGPAGDNGLGKHDRELLAQAKVQGKKTVTLIVSTGTNQNSKVATAVAALGGTVGYRDDAIGYLRVTVPLAAAAQVAAISGVEAVDVDEVVPLEDPRPDGQTGPVPYAAPDASTPKSNPYMPIRDTGAVDFVTAHPCLLYTSPSPRDRTRSRMPSSA